MLLTAMYYGTAQVFRVYHFGEIILDTKTNEDGTTSVLGNAVLGVMKLGG